MSEPLSPFEDPSKPFFGLLWPWWSAPFKLVLALVLCPIRVVMFCVVLLCFNLVSWIFTVCARVPTSLDDPPLARWRAIAIRAGSFVAGRLLLHCLGFHWISTSKRPNPQQPTQKLATQVIVSNHLGFGEVCMMMSLFGPSFVAKKDFLGYPVIGSLAKANQVIFVDRLDPQSRANTAKAMAKRAKQPEPGATKVWPPFVIFPEGTTTNGESVIQLQLGVFRLGVPLRVLAFKHPYKYFSPCWTTRNPAVQILGMMMQLYNRMEVVDFGVYVPTEEEVQDAQLFAQNVQELMASAFELQISPLTCFDYKLLANPHKHRRLHDPPPLIVSRPTPTQGVRHNSASVQDVYERRVSIVESLHGVESPVPTNPTPIEIDSILEDDDLELPPLAQGGGDKDQRIMSQFWDQKGSAAGMIAP